MKNFNLFANFFLFFTALFIFTGCDAPKSSYAPDFNVDGSNEGSKNYISINIVNEVKGSCVAIEELGTCIDYVGPYWTNYLMDLECRKIGVFKQEACPKTNLGGCKIHENYVAPIVSWYYNTSEKEFTEQEISKMKEICKKLIKGSEWQEPIL